LSNSIDGTPRVLSGQGFDYLSFAQFVLLHAGCALIFLTGVSWVAAGACIVFYCLRIFGLSAGYHRYFSHLSYRTGRGFQFLLAFLGAMAYQKGPLWWVAHHRRHHLHADRTGDVHSPVERGFWWAHCGWVFSRGSRGMDERMVTDLCKYPELRLLDRFYMLPPLMLAASTYLLGAMLERVAPGLGTNGLQMLVWGFFVSTVLVHHATYSANSFGHLVGGRRFDTKDGSRNNLFVALVTFGDGWHNNHHHYPPSARHGFYWWEVDVTLYVLKCLSRLGLVRGLKSPPERVYAEARSGKRSPASPAGAGGGAN
jgi:stearoyl-CoA desaturase (delta-9 desaturase)